MKLLHTKFEYHDSTLVKVAWLQDSELRLTFKLDGHWNYGSSIVVSVMFSGVRNPDVVKSSLCEIASKMTHDRWLADVVGIWRESNSSYLVDTSQGALVIDASSFAE